MDSGHRVLQSADCQYPPVPVRDQVCLITGIWGIMRIVLPWLLNVHQLTLTISLSIDTSQRLRSILTTGEFTPFSRAVRGCRLALHGGRHPRLVFINFEAVAFRRLWCNCVTGRHTFLLSARNGVKFHFCRLCKYGVAKAIGDTGSKKGIRE